MGAHNSKEKLSRSYSERYIHSQVIERERFGSFGKRNKGSAKKRDVRNLSISPTDLGPPPKAQQTVNGATNRVKSTVTPNAHKRVTSSGSGTPSLKTHSSTTSIKSSSTSPVNSRRSTIKITTTALAANSQAKLAAGTIAAAAATATTITTTKDSNRLNGIDQTPDSSSISKNGLRTEPPTELKEITCNGLQQKQQSQHNNNNSIPKENSQASTRTNSINSLPLPELEPHHHVNKKVNGTATHMAVGGMANFLDKKSTTTKIQTARKTQFQRQQKSSSEDKPLITTTAEYLDPSELQQLRLLNRHSCNGRLDFASLERELQQAERTQKHQDKSVEAFGVLIQYLVYELDAFSCPKFKTESLKAQNTLQKTVELLDEAKHACTTLQDQLYDKEAYYTQREEELQNLHRCELEKARSSYDDLQKQAKEEIAGLENQLCERDVEHQRAMNCYKQEMDNKFAEQTHQLTAAQTHEHELEERLAVRDATILELESKVAVLEKEALENANSAAERERALNERIATLTSDLDLLRTRQSSPSHKSQRIRRDDSELSHDEIAILRPMNRCSYDSRSASTITQQRGGSTSRASLPSELSSLQSEVESLRCVLEMRQSDISRLSKQNEELQRDADDRAAMRTKISMLTAHIEMLKSELAIKTEKEKECQSQLDKLQKDVSHEKTKRTRLSFDNEALQWQLKQRSEQLHILEGKLHESLNSSTCFNTSSMARHSSQNNCSTMSLTPFQTDNVSPPLSPIIKGVIEKPDSVAYVLEIDDETPEAAASKLVKRASSFRSVERSPVTRRQLSLSASVATVPTTILNGSSINVAACPSGSNPLSQSMSAASVIRQHSSESTHSARIRSRSVSIKDKDEPVSQKNATYELLPTAANSDTFNSSSPYINNIRPRTSTMKVETTLDEEQHEEHPLYKRLATSSSKPVGGLQMQSQLQPRLITCDTSALNSGERLDERMLPSHPSLHDLKVPKQRQEIKESAGEAMVSGANSEDEGCSASSDDMVSMHSSTSTDISAANTPLNMLATAANMSLEQVLLMDKVNSLSGTPMEMSWSDDVIESNELPAASSLAALNGSSNA